MKTKLKNFRLRKANLTKTDKEQLIDYCVNLGYVFDEEPEEFKGAYPIIRKSLKNQRKGFVQKINGTIWWVYNQKRENLSEAIKMQNDLIDKNVSKKHSLLRFFTGIIDFEYSNDYGNH